MNIDIINIGHYRVTSHGGRAYDLFNRQTDKVYKIDAEDFGYIKYGTGANEALTAVDRCEVVEAEHLDNL